MKAFVLPLALCLAHPLSAEVRQYTIDQLLSSTSWVGPPNPGAPLDYASSFSPDGSKILVSSNKTGVYNAFALPVDGGAPVQLTQSTVSAIRTIGYFPKDERFLYESDQGGNELVHLYVRELDGKVRDLTPGEKHRAELLDWAPDGRSIFFQTNERDPGLFDVYETTLDGYERKLLYTNPGEFVPAGVSPDRRLVVLTKARTRVDVDVLLHDRTTGKTTLLPLPGPAQNGFHTFSPDGKFLYYGSDHGGEFQRLMRYDLATGKSEEVLNPGWDVTAAAFSRSGRHLVVTVNNDSRVEIRILDAATLRPVELPRVPGLAVTDVEISPDGRRMAFFAESGSRLPDLYVRDLESGKDLRLTRSLAPEIDPADLVEGEVVRFKSWDGLEIPGILYKPRQASAANKVPAIVKVHGGPGGQSMVAYSGVIQYLVNHGYAVFDINNRGSGGYGKTFYGLDDRKHGEVDLDDCVASKKMLAATGWVDPDRIAIYGASYGGFMALAGLAFRPREFAAGIDSYGISNWKRTMDSIPAWWGARRDALIQEMGDPDKDAEALLKKSPLFHADKIERPLLVLQGANDPRVLQRESDSIVEAVRKKGVPVEYLVFENEGHGFRRKESQKRAFEAILAFLDKHLK